MVKIRLLTASDAEAYWALRVQALKRNPEAFASSYEEALKRENPIEQTAHNLSTIGSFTFGAFNQDQGLIGMVALVQEQHLKLSHKANIFAMYVAPHMRGKGIGEGLLVAAIEQAGLLKLDKINLTVVQTNETAKRLYEKCGFRVFGTETQALKLGDRYYDEDYMELVF